MELFKVMIRNRFTGTEYADSYWQREENAQGRMDHMRLSDSEEEKTEWHYWIARIKTSD